jgi:cobalt/nickel transport system permease protein
MLFAVHVADGVLASEWLIGGFAVAGLLVLGSLLRIKADDIPRISVFAAAFFVASQVHLPLGVTSVHLLLNAVVGVVLRRFAPVAIAEGLLLQALLFGHGGLTTLGVNMVVMTAPAMLATGLYPLLRKHTSFTGLLIGTLAATVTVCLNAGVLWLGGQEDWARLVRLVLLANVPVVVIEGLLTGVIVRYLELAKPDWLGQSVRSGNTSPNGTSH